MANTAGPSPVEASVRHAGIVLAAGLAAVPMAAAHAQIVVDDTDQAFPATLTLNGVEEFGVDGNGNVTGFGNNLITAYTAPPFASGYVAAKLGAGTAINGALFSSTNAPGRVGVGQAYLGNGFGKKNYYVGLELVGANGQDYFGWADINLGASNEGVNSPTDVVAYAFDTVAGQTIDAGQTSVPEPGSLAILAVGAAGALAIRRSTASRKAAKA